MSKYGPDVLAALGGLSTLSRCRRRLRADARRPSRIAARSSAASTRACTASRHGRQGQLVRLRRRLLPRGRGGDLQRPGKVRYVPLSARTFRRAEVRTDRRPVAQFDLDDVARDRRSGLSFAAVTYYDGQGFLVPASLTRVGARTRRQQGLRADRARRPSSISPTIFDANQMKYETVAGDRGRGDRRPTRPGAATCSPPTSRSSMPSG